MATNQKYTLYGLMLFSCSCRRKCRLAYSVIHEIHTLLCRDWKFLFEVVPRDANNVELCVGVFSFEFVLYVVLSLLLNSKYTKKKKSSSLLGLYSKIYPPSKPENDSWITGIKMIRGSCFLHHIFCIIIVFINFYMTCN